MKDPLAAALEPIVLDLLGQQRSDGDWVDAAARIAAAARGFTASEGQG